MAVRVWASCVCRRVCARGTLCGVAVPSASIFAHVCVRVRAWVCVGVGVHMCVGLYVIVERLRVRLVAVWELRWHGGGRRY